MLVDMLDLEPWALTFATGMTLMEAECIFSSWRAALDSTRGGHVGWGRSLSFLSPLLPLSLAHAVITTVLKDMLDLGARALTIATDMTLMEAE